MTERLIFIGKYLEGESMTDLCREFKITRPTGYKIIKRFRAEGLSGLHDRSTRPWKKANQTPTLIENAILELKDTHPTWGAPKLLAYLKRKSAYAKLPAKSTVHAILDRHGLVKRRVRRGHYKSEGTNLTEVKAPNELWCADFKGQFRMGNNKLCYPLTITDQHSRYLFGCEALESTREDQTIETFKNVFKEFGLPDAIRTDNGAPFGTRALFGLSRLTILWLRLGIKIERIKPGHPEQNGRHERMHRTLKQAVTNPAGANILQQQEMLDHFLNIYNNERPHEALSMQCPSDIYVASQKIYPRVIDDFDYSNCTKTRTVAKSGGIWLTRRHHVFISEVLAGQEVGLDEMEDGTWAVNFMNYPLGYFSEEINRFYPGANPFGAITA